MYSVKRSFFMEKFMLNKENEALYESIKVKDFVHRNEMSNLRKGTIIKRANARLMKKMEMLEKEGKFIDQDEMIRFVDRQIGKLDTPEKKKKKRPSQHFNTEWGEDLYRKNAFLGAEVNKMSEYAAVNKAIVTFIQNREKINKKITAEEMDKFLQNQMDRMDKKDLNEAEILRRNSIPEILTALRMESKPIALPVDDGSGYTLIMLEVAVNKLSYKETRMLRDVFQTEDDASSNTIYLEIGSVKDEDVTERDLIKTVEKASLIAAERCLKVWGKDYPINTTEIENIMKMMEADYREFLKDEKEDAKEREDIYKTEKKKLDKIDIVIRIIEVSILGYAGYQLYQYFS